MGRPCSFSVRLFVAVMVSTLQDLWGAAQDHDSPAMLCRGPMQSPIDIEPWSAVDGKGAEVRMLYRPWHLDDVDSVKMRGRVPTIQFRTADSPGMIQIGKDYHDNDEYVLTSLEVHSPSEHTFRRTNWPMEIQLWHEPRPLKRVCEIASRVDQLERSTRIIDDRLAAMDRIAAQLKGETEGFDSPWGSQTGATGADAQLDWIDSNKQDIAAEAARMRVDTKVHMEETAKLARSVERLVTAQRRPHSTQRVAMSIFLLRSPPSFLGTQNGSTSTLVEWVTAAMSDAQTTLGRRLLHGKHGNKSRGSTAQAEEERRRRVVTGSRRRKKKKGSTAQALEFVESQYAELNLAEAMGGGRGADSTWNFFAYEGSLAHPPCTPDVQWLVAEEPLPASVLDLERLIELTQLEDNDKSSVSNSAIQVLGDDREIQPIGQDRKLHTVTLTDKPFTVPLYAREDSSEVLKGGKTPDGAKKWTMVERYCKVFFLCATFIFFAPILFLLVEYCSCADLQDTDIDEVQGQNQHYQQLDSDIEGAGSAIGLELRPMTLKKNSQSPTPMTLSQRRGASLAIQMQGSLATTTTKSDRVKGSELDSRGVNERRVLASILTKESLPPILSQEALPKFSEEQAIGNKATREKRNGSKERVTFSDSAPEEEGLGDGASSASGCSSLVSGNGNK